MKLENIKTFISSFFILLFTFGCFLNVSSQNPKLNKNPASAIFPAISHYHVHHPDAASRYFCELALATLEAQAAQKIAATIRG